MERGGEVELKRVEEDTPKVSLLERLLNLVTEPKAGSGGESDSVSIASAAGLEGGAPGGVGYRGRKFPLASGPERWTCDSLRRFISLRRWLSLATLRLISAGGAEGLKGKEIEEGESIPGWLSELNPGLAVGWEVPLPAPLRVCLASRGNGAAMAS